MTWLASSTPIRRRSKLSSSGWRRKRPISSMQLKDGPHRVDLAAMRGLSMHGNEFAGPGLLRYRRIGEGDHAQPRHPTHSRLSAHFDRPPPRRESRQIAGSQEDSADHGNSSFGYRRAKASGTVKAQ